jgi:hypothetical protein
VKTLIRRVTIAGEVMTRRLPLGPGGPLASGAPPTETRFGGGSLGAP